MSYGHKNVECVQLSQSSAVNCLLWVYLVSVFLNSCMLPFCSLQVNAGEMIKYSNTAGARVSCFNR